MITIRFVSHPGIFNWGTEKFQYGFWADHVDTVLPDGRLLGAHFAGVQILPSNYDAGKFSRELRVSLKTTEVQEMGFYSFLSNQVGKPYDFRALIAFAFNRDWQSPDSWICDELVAAAFAACGIFPQHLAIGFNRITLRDLLLLVSTLVEVRDG